MQFGGIDAVVVEYGKDGQARTPDDASAVRSFVRDRAIDDLVVLSHGWRTDGRGANSMYDAIAPHIAKAAARIPALQGRRIGLLAVRWPAKHFGARDGVFALSAGKTTIDDILDGFIESLDEERAADAGPDLRVAARDAASDETRLPLLLERIQRAMDDMPEEELEDADAFFKTYVPTDGMELAAAFSDPSAAPADDGAHWEDGTIGAMGGIAESRAGQVVAGLLNYATYYQMKARAGNVGRLGLASTLQGVRAAKRDLRLHLVGHSFGARLVTAATSIFGQAAADRPNSLTLLQAAFSHNAFSPDVPAGRGGGFRRVVGSAYVDGPIVVTHTHADGAIKNWYAHASRLAGQNAEWGGPGDPFGGLGANGAQNTPEATDAKLLPADAPGYAFQSGRISNLLADGIIQHHNDIQSAEVGWAIANGMAS